MANFWVYSTGDSSWHLLNDPSVYDNAGDGYVVPKRLWVYDGPSAAWHYLDNFTHPPVVPGIIISRTGTITDPTATVNWTPDNDSTQDDYDYNVNISFFRNGVFSESFVVSQTIGTVGVESSIYATGDHVFARLFYSTPNHSGSTSDSSTIIL